MMHSTEKVINSTGILLPSTNRFAECLKKVKSIVFSRKHGIKYFLAALLLLNIIDGLVTNALINNNIAHEGNLILMGVAGGPRLIVVKFLGVLLAAAVLWDIYRHHPKLALWTSITFSLVYSGIVAWNVSLLLMG